MVNKFPWIVSIDKGHEWILKGLKNHTMLEGERVSANFKGSIVHVGNARLFKRLGLFNNLSSINKKTDSNKMMLILII